MEVNLGDFYREGGGWNLKVVFLSCVVRIDVFFCSFEDDMQVVLETRSQAGRGRRVANRKNANKNDKQNLPTV